MRNFVIKMIGIDLDGTLFDSEKKISAYTKDILAKAIKQEILVVIATGRALYGVPKEIRTLPGLRYVLSANGARITDQVEDKILYESLIKEEDAEKVLSIFAKYDAAKEVVYAGRGHMEQKYLDAIRDYVKTEVLVQYMQNSKVAVKNLQETLEAMKKPVEKVHALFKTEAERRKAWEEVAALNLFELSSSLGNNIEVGRKGTNKGTGILQLGKLLGIEKKEIMAFGDDLNDLEMIRDVGFGVAMKNANDQVKQVAKYVTESNDNDGVARAIEELVLKEKGEKCWIY